MIHVFVQSSFLLIFNISTLCITLEKAKALGCRDCCTGSRQRNALPVALARGTVWAGTTLRDHPCFIVGRETLSLPPPLSHLSEFWITENHDTHNYTLWIFFVFYSWSIKSCKTLLIPHRMICVSEPTANVTDDCLWHQHWLSTLLQTDGTLYAAPLPKEPPAGPPNLELCWYWPFNITTAAAHQWPSVISL